ncbi:hypothetical protein [Celeribacter ethanolicus]|nr:hypothetical protein [Celeribacter ethanolicus]
MFQMLLWFLRMMSRATGLDAAAGLQRRQACRQGTRKQAPDAFGR